MKKEKGSEIKIEIVLQYLPTVIGVLVITYPPSTEFWWEPREPLQIAFWSLSAACMFLMVIVVMCCILWRNAKRQADRFYDGDIFIDAAESEGVLGIENAAAHAHPRDNIYEFKDTKKAKSLPDTTTSSLRSPSSLGITQSTKMGSQSSVSAISLRESPVTPTPKDAAEKSSKISVSSNPRGGKYDDSRNLLSSYDKSHDALSSSASDTIKTSTTPVPSARKSIKTSRTHLVEGVPQTEV